VLARRVPESVLLVYSGESATRQEGMFPRGDPRPRAGAHAQNTVGGNTLYYSEHVDTTRLSDAEYVRDIRSLLRSKYAGAQARSDLRVRRRGGRFHLEGPRQLLPRDTGGLRYRDPVVAMPNSTGVVGRVSQARVLDTALRVRPDTTSVAIVAGTTAYDQYYVRSAPRAFTSYEGRLTFTYLTGLPVRELLSRVGGPAAALDHSLHGRDEDAEGRMFLPQRS